MDRIKIIGDNYPQVGETFYWKDEDGIMHDDICLKIEKDPEGNVETNYFIYLSPNGGGSFVDETCIVNPLSMEIEVYKQKKAKEKIKEISDYLSKEEIKDILFKKLVDNAFTRNEAYKILHILGSYE